MELPADDRALLEEAADALVKRRLALPAIMFLETVSPMNTVSAAMLNVLMPVWSVVVPQTRLKRLAELLENRETIPELIRIIDEADEARRREEADARRERKARRKARKHERTSP